MDGRNVGFKPSLSVKWNSYLCKQSVGYFEDKSVLPNSLNNPYVWVNHVQLSYICT